MRMINNDSPETRNEVIEYLKKLHFFAILSLNFVVEIFALKKGKTMKKTKIKKKKTITMKLYHTIFWHPKEVYIRKLH